MKTRQTQREREREHRDDTIIPPSDHAESSLGEEGCEGPSIVEFWCLEDTLGMHVAAQKRASFV